jgi:excinuclease ABC subunit A
MYKEEINYNTINLKKNIVLRGVRVHNLKNFDLVLPKNKLIVLTGVSGSGKSSLAFDTLYAEGQRRYIESLSAYSRQFLERMEKPDVDSILGISPAIAVEQKNTIRNPRSTVGTTTEIYDYLRLLFARIGKTYCHKCGRLVKKDTVKTVLDQLQKLEDGKKIYILFPLEKSTGLIFKEKIENLQKGGFFRIFENNEIIDLSQNPKLSHKYEGKYVLVDRLSFSKEKSLKDNRLADSIETAFKGGNGEMLIRVLDDNSDFSFSNSFECADCKIVYEEPDLHLLSFNNPRGACKVCQGFGQFINFDMDLVVPEPRKSIKDGAIAVWNKFRFERYNNELISMCKKNDINTEAPFSSFNKIDLKKIILGHDSFIGIKGFFDEAEKRLFVPEYSKIYFKYRGATVCPECEGSRLRSDVLNIFVADKNIKDVVNMDVDSALLFFKDLELSDVDYEISFRILQEISKRIQYLNEVGLGYITINRSSYSLSGGEAQRINLATSLGAALVGTMYILDEPSIGLHPRDNYKLINILKSIRDLGNTVIVVEHDPDMMLNADLIVDLGPGAGAEGGNIIFSGSYDEIIADQNSLTGKYLSKAVQIEVPEKRRFSNKFIEITGASENNLKNIELQIPLNTFVCVTGVSGSGKSTLIIDVLYSALKRFEKIKVNLKTIENEMIFESGNLKKISGLKNINSVELIDQSPIGKSSRSNPATYIKAFDIIRDIFSQTAQSKSRGYTVSYFSFNQPEGRCDMCEGEGYQTIEMQFMADISLPCESCKGKRFKNEVLEIFYKGKNIDDILNLTVSDAIKFFENHKRLIRKLKVLEDVGLGYLKLGQSSSTFSGGEAQRIKLATHLEISEDQQNKLFIFDEPTTGLHFVDIAKLLGCFTSLLNAGNSLVVIKHNMDIIKSADYIIDLGPEGGDKGGNIIAYGTPEEIVNCDNSHTGKILRSYL